MNTDQLTTRVADQLGAQQRLLVAFSGGTDSSVLLHALAALRRQRPALQLRALHVHHGLSAFADRWVEHCRSRCADWQIPLTVTHVQVDARRGGIEAAARAARYAAFSTALTEGSAAHRSTPRRSKRNFPVGAQARQRAGGAVGDGGARGVG